MQAINQDQAVTQTSAVVPTNRDRVRELLFDPLGFRHPRGIDAERGQKFLDAIADEFSHLTDDHLSVLARMIAVHGAGSAKNFWPDRATFLGFAHSVCPRPLTADPKLLGWFGSVEGPKAILEGTLVETYRYFEAKRRPPYTDQAMRLVRQRSDENIGRAARIEERLARSSFVGEENMQWFRWYNDLQEKLVALVDGERLKRGKEGGQ